MRSNYQFQILEILHITGIKPNQLLDLTFLFWKFNQLYPSSRVDNNAMIFLDIMKNDGRMISGYFRDSSLTDEVINRLFSKKIRFLLDAKVVLDYFSMLDKNIYLSSMKFLSELKDREYNEVQISTELSKFIAWLLVEDSNEDLSAFSYTAHNSSVLQYIIETGKANNFICYESSFDHVIDRQIQFDFNDVSSFSIIDYPIYGNEQVDSPLDVDIAFSQFPWFIDLPKEVSENRFFGVSSFPDFAFLINLASTLSKNGKAVTVIHDALFRLEKFKKDRQSLIESGFIESVISLPSRSILGYSGKPCLIILSRNNGNIKCCDFSKLGKLSKEKFKIEYQARNDKTYKVIDLIEIENIGYRIDFTKLFHQDKEKSNVVK